MFVSKRHDDVVISAITEFELLFGALNSDHPDQEKQRVEQFLSRFDCVPYDRLAAQVAAEIHWQLKSAGKEIGPLDLQIAATAILSKATLVTHNTKEFSRVPHLQWEDWET
jgi:tRNA(fMet)-specific endonuclease VapC